MSKSKFKFYNNAGLYVTVIVHLIALIIFLSIKIHSSIPQEESFVFDFSKQEEIERQEEERSFKKSVSRELDALLASRLSASEVRNIAVNTEDLKDSKNIDPKELYQDMKRLEDELKANREKIEKLDGESEYAVQDKNRLSPDQKQVYAGPSVIRWTLRGRNNIHLPIPAYKCEGAGIVTVAVSVNRKGYVKAAYVMETESSTDECLRKYALEAARKSRFSASASAPDRQAGEIVYSFVAQ